jgi:hypothetical protein
VFGASPGHDAAQYTIVAWAFRQHKRFVRLTGIRGAFHLINDAEAEAFQKSPGFPRQVVTGVPDTSRGSCCRRW